MHAHNKDLSFLRKKTEQNKTKTKTNKMVREPNVSPQKQIIKDDDVKECISIE